MLGHSIVRCSQWRANRTLSVFGSVFIPVGDNRDQPAVQRNAIHTSSPLHSKTADERVENVKHESKIDSILSTLRMHPDQLVAKPGTDPRWMVPAATINHLSLGSIYAWSMFNLPLTRLHGVVAPASSDWLLSDTTLTFSLVMGGFAWGALLSNQLDRFGPRACCLIGAGSLGAGFSLASLSVQLESLPLLYLGGAVWGLANGWAYVPPVSTLIKWFPNNKGFASGMCLVGYGAGSLVAAPLFQRLLENFQRAPEYLGKAGEVALTSTDGKLFAEVAGMPEEVVVATTQDIVQCNMPGLAEGVYLVGTGSTGVAETFACLGVFYATAMAATSFVFRLPWEGYEEGKLAEARPEAAPPATEVSITPHQAMFTKEFYILYGGFGCAAMGAYGFLSSGKTMLTECFGTAMPDVVTSAFAASFVGMMGLANLSGRLGWSTASDYLGRRLGDPFLGRKRTFGLMWGILPPIYLATIWSVHQCALVAGEEGARATSALDMLPLGVFAAGVFGVVSSFGGAAATRPPMIADIYGSQNVSVLSARQLSVVLPSAYLGPKLAMKFREDSMNEQIGELSGLITDQAFVDSFGAPKAELDLLISQKTVTIPRLMDLVPDGTVDPTPFCYDKVLYMFIGLQAVAILSNVLIRPVKSVAAEKREE